jgi:hypothetical protein
MAAPKLSQTERLRIAERLAAGDTYAVVAAAIGTTVSNVKYYARKSRPRIEAAKEVRITEAITAGLSEVDARVSQLEWLNGLLQADLDTGLYGVDIKMSATGKTVEVPSFKGAQVAQIRGTLDDIAKERGGRKTKMEVTGKDGESISYTLHFDRADDARELHPPESLPEAT